MGFLQIKLGLALAELGKILEYTDVNNVSYTAKKRERSLEAKICNGAKRGILRDSYRQGGIPLWYGTCLIP